ncbi:MAG: CDP-alcohol phosphatidyltransferase family protein, partial [Candidatus Eisenbacteria bacterium]|nr:CDP-alcohol phosphatidyltransferase family protein [Candidatus Eisenbacteria bacterium]
MASGGSFSARDWRAPPNIVTLVRLAMVVPSLLLLASGMRYWAAAVAVAMFATDGLDGYLARKLDRVTELGKILDPTADKVAVGAILLYLVKAGEFPVWALILVAARDVGIALVGIALARRSGSVPQALPAGKAALVVLAAVVVVFVADLRALEPAGLFFLAAAVLVSGAFYSAAAVGA